MVRGLIVRQLVVGAGFVEALQRLAGARNWGSGVEHDLLHGLQDKFRP